MLTTFSGTVGGQVRQVLLYLDYTEMHGQQNKKMYVTVLGLVSVITISQFSHNRLLVACCGKKCKFSVLCWQQKCSFTHLSH